MNWNKLLDWIGFAVVAILLSPVVIFIYGGLLTLFLILADGLIYVWFNHHFLSDSVLQRMYL